MADVDKVIATQAARLVDRVAAGRPRAPARRGGDGGVSRCRHTRGDRRRAHPQGTWIKAYGEADPVAHAPMTADMHTRVGSITKTFTGTLLMQLQEQGMVSLDDTIDRYVTGVPNGDVISLRQLANMTSGVASYTRNQAFVDALSTNPTAVFTPEQLLAYGLSQSPSFAPGAQFDYSNTNTILLGIVIEKVTGQPIGDVFKEQILDPLQLNNTIWPGTSPDMPTPYPQGFTLQSQDATPDHPGNATNWNPSWGWTAGAMIMDMRDLLTYGRALGTGQGLLGPAAQAERLTSFPGSAGYGLAVGCIDGWVGHAGELPGYNTSRLLRHDERYRRGGANEHRHCFWQLRPIADAHGRPAYQPLLVARQLPSSCPCLRRSATRSRRTHNSKPDSVVRDRPETAPGIGGRA